MRRQGWMSLGRGLSRGDGEGGSRLDTEQTSRDKNFGLSTFCLRIRTEVRAQ